jgi:hypothetical protein
VAAGAPARGERLLSLPVDLDRLLVRGAQLDELGGRRFDAPDELAVRGELLAVGDLLGEQRWDHVAPTAGVGPAIGTAQLRPWRRPRPRFGDGGR